MRRSRRPMACLGRAAAASILAACALVPAAPARAATPAELAADHGAEVVLRALSLLGVSYRFGGNTPETGLDCSGLVRLVFQEAVAMPLPRRSEEMSRVGDRIDPSQLQPGDLVFFNTLRRAFSHVGIYIGNGRFVHAPSTGGTIRVDELGKRYWTSRFDGARRLLPTDTAVAAVVPRAERAVGSAAMASGTATARRTAPRPATAPGAPALRPVAGPPGAVVDREFTVN